MRPVVLTGILALSLLASPAASQCPDEPSLQNFTGAASVVCPCFVAGEEAGVILTPPAAHLPIEVLRVGIAWASQFGGSPQSLEQSVNVYATGLPNPGAPIASLGGPVMTDGFLNEFDLGTLLPGQIIVNNPSFMVSLTFLNDNSGQFFAPSVTHDGNGCQPGKNAVKVIPGGWADACALGVTGDWIFYVVYRQANCAVGAEEILVAGSTAMLAPQPNPFRDDTTVRFVLDRTGPVNLSVYDVQGRLVNVLQSGEMAAGPHQLTWNGRRTDGSVAVAGTYFVRMESGAFRSTDKVVRLR